MIQTGSTLNITGCFLSIADIDLKAGATLRIINGGVLETRNGFVAPVGANVTISNGKIL